jgi:hypothetical protein
MNLLNLLLIFIYSFQPAACWGDLGHRTVAYLAQKFLSKEAAQLIDDLLPSSDGWDFSDAAVWPDKVKFHGPFEGMFSYESILKALGNTGSNAPGTAAGLLIASPNTESPDCTC